MLQLIFDTLLSMVNCQTFTNILTALSSGISVYKRVRRSVFTDSKIYSQTGDISFQKMTVSVSQSLGDSSQDIKIIQKIIIIQ